MRAVVVGLRPLDRHEGGEQAGPLARSLPNGQCGWKRRTRRSRSGVELQLAAFKESLGERSLRGSWLRARAGGHSRSRRSRVEHRATEAVEAWRRSASEEDRARGRVVARPQAAILQGSDHLALAASAMAVDERAGLSFADRKRAGLLAMGRALRHPLPAADRLAAERVRQFPGGEQRRHR